MLWTFDMEGFMSYMVAEFPEPMSNHFTYDLVQNVVEDAQMRYLEKNHFAAMLASRIPEVTKEDVLMFCVKERMDERDVNVFYYEKMHRSNKEALMTRDEAEGKFYQLAALSLRTKLLENEIRKALGKNGGSSFLHTVFQDIRANGSDNLDNLLKLMELKQYFSNNSKTSPLIKSALFGEITPGTVVNCKTEKEARELLSFAEELGYFWLDHEKPSQHIRFAFHGDQTCYKFSDELDLYGREGKLISFGALSTFKSREIPVLSYNEFFTSLQKQVLENLDEGREER